MEVLHSAKCDLASHVLRDHGSLRLRVDGTSMLPALWPGDVVRIERLPADAVAPGDVVLFYRAGRLFLHRVAQATATHLHTYGDAWRLPDPPVSATEFLGRATHLEDSGCFSALAPVSGWRSALSVLLRWRPVRTLTCWCHARWMRRTLDEAAWQGQ